MTPNPQLAFANQDHPAAAQAPKTLREALEHARAFLDSDRCIGQANFCKYSYPDGTNCIVGSFFTQEQLSDLKRRRTNTHKVESLAQDGHVTWPGTKNVELMTGMTVEQAQALQDTFDAATRHNGDRKPLKRWLDKVLDTGYGRLRSVRFKL